MELSLRRRLYGATLVSVLLVGLVVSAAPVGAQAQSPDPGPGDTIGIVKSDESPSNAEIAVRLSEATPFADVSTVVIGRDDEFADSLASGVLQSSSPLLLVPRGGPVPERVRTELARLAPSRVLLLGGEAAVEPAVEQELEGLGYAVERRAGASRFETATAIAGTDAAASDTAILARAFPAPGATDPTQGFADALAAGGLAAEMGWPVLLTQTEVLTGTTREYLRTSGITTVKLMGGTAAISQAVEQELSAMGIATERLAGGSRAETAVEVAKERGAETAADAAHVLLVQGQTADAWAGGFAAAAHSAALDAPIVLAVETQLPPATTEWLADGAQTGGTAPAFAVDPSDGGPVLTCVTVPALCEDARIALGLPPAGEARSYELLSGGLDDATQGGASGPAASDDGQVVAFTLFDAEGDGGWHTYVHRDGAIAQVDVTDPGASAAPGTSPPDVAVSGDGTRIAFTSPDQSLDPAAPVDASVSGYVADLTTGTTRHVTVDARGNPIPIADNVSLDDDGSVVAYTGQGETGEQVGCACTWLWLHDLDTGAVDVVRDADGRPLSVSNNPTSPALSADGQLVAFQTAQPLLPADDNQGSDVYLLDRVTGRIELVSVADDGTSGGNDNTNPSPELGMSADGRYVAFWYGAGDLVAGEDTGSAEIYLRDRQTGTTIRLSQGGTGALGSSSGRTDVAADGSAVVFTADRPLTDDAQGGCGTYRHDVATGELVRVDVTAGGNTGCPVRVAAGTGGVVVFDTPAQLVAEDADSGPDVYRTAV